MKTISRIAYSNDKRNRTRSILIMMAICLTTMLLVIISTVGNGVIHLQKSQAAGSYGSNYGLFVSADGSQLKEVNRRAEIDATGTMCTEGIIKGNEKGGFVCMDEDTYIVNTNTGKFHKPSCRSVKQMKEANKSERTTTRDELISEGYEPCKNCNP